MRNLLYVVGALCTLFGAIKSYDASQFGDAIVSMLVVVCGAVLIGSAAVVGAIDAMRSPPMPTGLAPPTLQQPPWQPPG